MQLLSTVINVNIPGLLPLVQQLGNQIMTKLDELNASTDALAAKVEEDNTKTDALITVANATKDALVALQGQPGGVTDAQLQAVIDKQTAAVTSITAQEAETDAAAAADTP